MSILLPDTCDSAHVSDRGVQTKVGWFRAVLRNESLQQVLPFGRVVEKQMQGLQRPHHVPHLLESTRFHDHEVQAVGLAVHICCLGILLTYYGRRSLTLARHISSTIVTLTPAEGHDKT